MRNDIRNSRILCAVLLACSLLLLQSGWSQSAPTTSSQRMFASPQQAVDTLIKAAGDYDVTALLQIFGPAGEDFISSADPVADKKKSLQFAALAAQKTSIQKSKNNLATIVVGDNDWPFPVPLVKKNGQWVFDTARGREEILFRRIGENELDAIQICRGFVEAQNKYASEVRDGFGVNQYAQKILSTPGKQDGLYWEDQDGTPAGPISKPVARAIEEGYSVDKRSAYHGYYFKVLKGQGPNAPLGQIDYVIQGAMIGGFALVAVPSEYRVTGVKTFIVSQDGIVYQKDLGPDSLKLAKEMDLYNPDKTWQPTNDGWPSEVAMTVSGQ
jgi:hypothetical protein